MRGFAVRGHKSHWDRIWEFLRVEGLALNPTPLNPRPLNPIDP